MYWVWLQDLAARQKRTLLKMGKPGTILPLMNTRQPSPSRALIFYSIKAFDILVLHLMQL